MKKSVVCCAVSWVILAILVMGLHNYAHHHVAQRELVMENPAVSLIVDGDGKLALQWEIVDYATSYRIYRTNEAGGWELLKAVSGDDNAYALPEGSSTDRTYAVRACNVSVIGTTLSGYSKAAIGGT